MVRLWPTILLFMLILTACQSRQNESDKGLNLSQEQLDRFMQTQLPSGDQQQVTALQMIGRMEGILTQQPNDTTLLYELAKLCYEHYPDDSNVVVLQKSIQYNSQVIELDPRYKEGRAYYNRMLAHWASGNYAAGLKDIESFVAINQHRTPVNYRAMQAELLYLQGNIDQACAVFGQAKVVAQEDSLPIGDTTVWITRCM